MGLNAPSFLGVQGWLSGLSFGLLKAGLSTSQTGIVVALCLSKRDAMNSSIICTELCHDTFESGDMYIYILS